MSLEKVHNNLPELTSIVTLADTTRCNRTAKDTVQPGNWRGSTNDEGGGTSVDDRTDVAQDRLTITLDVVHGHLPVTLNDQH